MVTEQERYLVERLEDVAPVRARRMFGGVGLYHDGHFFALIADERLFFRVDDENRARFDARGAEAFRPFADRPASISYRAVPEDVLVDARRLRPWFEGAVDAARRKAAVTRTKKTRPAKRTGNTDRSEPATTKHTAPTTRTAARKEPLHETAQKPAEKSRKALTKRTARKTAPKDAKKDAPTATHASTPESPRAARRAEKIQNLGPVSRRNLAEVGVHTLADLAERGSVDVFRAVRARGLESSANLLYALEGALLGLRWDRLPEVVKRNLRERAGIDRVR